jgi:hypothetical protein
VSAEKTVVEVLLGNLTAITNGGDAMIFPDKSGAGKLVCVGVSLLFLGFAAQPSLAQQDAKRSDQQPQRGQMERGQREASSYRGDHERWDITDEAIEAWVTIKLAARPGLDNVRVEVRDGVARVSGKVGSEAAESRALRITGNTFGVRSVSDQLSVDKALLDRKIERVSDRDLAQQVARAVAGNIEGARAGEDWWFTGWRVEGSYNRWNLVVEADDGRIHLEGEVPDMQIMRKAVEAARAVRGVRTVDSDLELERYYGFYGPDYYRAYPGIYDYYPYHPYARGSYGRKFNDDRVSQGR